MPSKWLYLVVIIDPGKDFFEEDHEYNDDYADTILGSENILM